MGEGTLKFVIAIISIGLFTFAILTFAVQFASDNDAAVSLADDAELVALSTNTETDISSKSDDAEDTYQSIVDTAISPDAGTAQSIAPFSVGTNNSLSIVINILEVGYVKIFGTGAGFGVFLTSLIAILLFTVAYFAYKALRGLPD